MSDDDWEDADIPAPVVVNKNKFKDEVEHVVFDEPAPSAPSTTAAAAAQHKPHLTKAQLKAQEAEAAERASRPMTAQEKQAEALRLRKAVEDADQELASALFGNEAKPAVAAAPAAVAAVAAPKPLAAKKAAAAAGAVQDLKGLTEFFSEVPLSNANQAKNVAVALSKRVTTGAKKDVQIVFLKEMLQQCCEALTDNDVNALTGVLSVIKNEKVKAKFAKKVVVRPNLNTRGLDKEGGERDDHDNYDYDDYDDDGFM